MFGSFAFCDGVSGVSIRDIVADMLWNSGFAVWELCNIRGFLAMFGCTDLEKGFSRFCGSFQTGQLSDRDFAPGQRLRVLLQTGSEALIGRLHMQMTDTETTVCLCCVFDATTIYPFKSMRMGLAIVRGLKPRTHQLSM